MVQCLQANPREGCEEERDCSGFESPIKCPVKCDYTKIVGRDHLKQNRARKFQCKSKRLKILAQPKNYTRKYQEEFKNRKPTIEVIRSFEEQTPVRIKLLAYPKVHQLVSSRDQYKQIVDKEWYGRFNSLIKKSMLTMYSRLTNVQLPDKSHGKKWTKADWQRHCEWMKSRALPKIPKESPPIKRKKTPLAASIFTLSRPRQPRMKFRPYCGYESTVKEESLLYKPTDRILKLAEPKNLMAKEVVEAFMPFQVNPTAFKYNPTQRLKELAAPKAQPKPTKIPEVLTEYGVSKFALKGTVNQRIVELAKPKERGGDDDDDEEKPLVNPKALKYKASKRILEMATPRKVLVEVSKH